MKVLRSSLIAAAALVAAACGDKVNVVQPVTPHAVHSVIVSPATLTLVVTQTATLTAAVTADSGAVVTPIVWSTSDATKVSVDQTGKVTAVAVTPGVAVCAAVGGAQGCASVIVSAGTGTNPATVSIASITAGALFIPVPVPPAAVAGQINVTLNVSANSVALDSVIVTVDGATAAKQTFSAAQAAALISISAMTADQVTPPPSTIVLSFNTGNFNPTTGAVSYKNGLHNIGAKSFGNFVSFTGTKTPTTSTAAQVIQLLFGNVSGFIGAMTITPTAPQIASAVDGAGYNWRAGGMAVTALPVIFGSETVLNATLTFNTLGCAATGLKVLTLTAPVAPSFMWTGTFTNSLPGAALFGTATDVGDYELNPAAGGNCGLALTAGGEIPNIVAVGSDNNNIVLFGAGPVGGAGFLNAATSNLNPDPNFIVRLDNVAPSAPVITMIPNNRTGNWFNDVVVLNGLNKPSTPNGTVCTVTSPALDCPVAGPAPADLGSGRLGQVTLTARTGLTTDATASVDAGAAVTSTAALAESGAPPVYRLRVRADDILHNNVSKGSAAAQSFAVDRTAPTLAIIGGPAANARNIVAAGPYFFAATDLATPPAAPSGFFNLAGTPLTVNQLRRAAITGSKWWCPPAAAYISIATGCVGVNGWNPASSQNFKANLNWSDVNGSIVDAYYTINATVADQAGNVSNVATGVELTDATPPSIGGLSYPAFLTAGGSTLFQSSDIDNLDIQLERMNLQYGPIQPGAPGTFAPTGAAFTSPLGGSTFWYPDAPVNGYNLPALVTTHAFAFTVGNLLTNIQVTGAAGANGAAVNANGVLNTANGIVLDQANNQALTGTPIIPGALPAPAAITNTGLAGAGPVNFVISGAAPVNLSVSGAGGLATSTAYTATAQGVTGVFNNPFSSVQFWAYDPTTAVPATEGWRLFATVGATTTTDGGAAVPNGRNWGYTATFAPSLTNAPDQAACPAGTVYQIMAIGISSVATSPGMALASNVSAKTASVCP